MFNQQSTLSQEALHSGENTESVEKKLYELGENIKVLIVLSQNMFQGFRLMIGPHLVLLWHWCRTKYVMFPNSPAEGTPLTISLLTVYWSCRSVYRRQDVCVAKVILWILTSCTYWWENRYPPPILGWCPPHSWLMTPPILDWWPPPILGWWKYPRTSMAPPILGWCPPHSWLMTPPTHTCLMPPPPMVGWCAESSWF